MALNTDEKEEIKRILEKGDENSLFEYIEKLLLERIRFTIDYCDAEQIVKKGNKAKEFWGKEEEELYQKFLTMPEKVKKGRHTKYFKNAIESGLTDITLNRYYRKFVKRYELQKIDDDLIELAKNMT